MPVNAELTRPSATRTLSPIGDRFSDIVGASLSEIEEAGNQIIGQKLAIPVYDIEKVRNDDNKQPKPSTPTPVTRPKPERERPGGPAGPSREPGRRQPLPKRPTQPQRPTKPRLFR